MRLACQSFAVSAFFGAAFLARAGSLLPGTVGTPDQFPNLTSTSISIPADTGPQAFSFLDSGLTVSGDYEEFVISDSANVYCSNCLDFGVIAVVDPTSAYGLNEISMQGYASYFTDAGYDANASFNNVAADLSPTSVVRSANGGAVNFIFGPTNPVLPGEGTFLVVIETNATAFNAAPFQKLTLSDTSDSHQATVIIYDGPTGAAVVPEPSGFQLLGAGVLAIGLLRRKPAH